MSQMKNVFKLVEFILATRDNRGDNRGVKDKLNEVGDGGATNVEHEIT